MRIAVAMFAILLASCSAYAAEPSALARARALYNAADYDGAIAAAATARTQATASDAAALVEARAHLERYRRSADSTDLSAARDALNDIHVNILSPRDQLDFLVGLGQLLYVTDVFGAAAELFDTALGRDTPLAPRDRTMLLEWWAQSLEREAQAAMPARRMSLAEKIGARMKDELQRDPGSAAANYWLIVAERGAGDLEAAWDAAVAAWVRARLGPSTLELRSDIDVLVTDVLIGDLARSRLAREQVDVTETLRAQWELVKQQWK